MFVFGMSIRHRQNSTFKQFKCCSCGDHFALVEELESHLASMHVMYMAYECDFCGNVLFPSDFALREHYTKIHNKKSFTIKYRVSPELDERRELLRRLVAKSTHQTDSGALADHWLQNKATNSDTDASSYTFQLLKNCSSLLQNQLLMSNCLLNTTVDVKEEENNRNSDNCDGDEATEGGRKPIGQYLSYAEEKALANEKQTFSEEYNSTLLDRHLSQFPVRSRDDSLNLEETNDVKPEIKVSPIKQRAKRRRVSQNHQLQANTSQGTTEDAKQRGPMVECLECKRMVGQYRNSMLIHVSTHHCDEPIFECLSDGCGKKWYSISARTKEHIESKHNGDFTFLQDNRRLLLPSLRLIAARLFPGDY